MNTQACLEGYKAYEDYAHLSDNPYPLNVGVHDSHWHWESGFLLARTIDNGDA